MSQSTETVAGHGKCDGSCDPSSGAHCYECDEPWPCEVARMQATIVEQAATIEGLCAERDDLSRALAEETSKVVNAHRELQAAREKIARLREAVDFAIGNGCYSKCTNLDALQVALNATDAQ